MDKVIQDHVQWCALVLEELGHSGSATTELLNKNSTKDDFHIINVTVLWDTHKTCYFILSNLHIIMGELILCVVALNSNTFLPNMNNHGLKPFCYVISIKYSK